MFLNIFFIIHFFENIFSPSNFATITVEELIVKIFVVVLNISKNLSTTIIKPIPEAGIPKIPNIIITMIILPDGIAATPSVVTKESKKIVVWVVKFKSTL